jgi:hypothetical protein
MKKKSNVLTFDKFLNENRIEGKFKVDRGIDRSSDFPKRVEGKFKVGGGIDRSSDWPEKVDHIVALYLKVAYESGDIDQGQYNAALDILNMSPVSDSEYIRFQTHGGAVTTANQRQMKNTLLADRRAFDM